MARHVKFLLVPCGALSEHALGSGGCRLVSAFAK